MDGSEEFVQSLGGRFPAKSLSGSRIEGERDGRKDIGIMHAEIGSLGKVLAQQAVGILVRTSPLTNRPRVESMHVGVVQIET